MLEKTRFTENGLGEDGLCSSNDEALEAEGEEEAKPEAGSVNIEEDCAEALLCFLMLGPLMVVLLPVVLVLMIPFVVVFIPMLPFFLIWFILSLDP